MTCDTDAAPGDANIALTSNDALTESVVVVSNHKQNLINDNDSDDNDADEEHSDDKLNLVKTEILKLEVIKTSFSIFVVTIIWNQSSGAGC